MQNEEGQMMDLYIPMKSSATNNIITAKDHASVQINIGHVDESGVYTGQFTTFALCGFIRAQLKFLGLMLKSWTYLCMVVANLLVSVASFIILPHYIGGIQEMRRAGRC